MKTNIPIFKSKIILSFSIILFFLLSITFAMLSCDDSEDNKSNGDCEIAEDTWGTPEAGLGEKCFSGSYGSCPNNYNNCMEGDCMFSDSANSSICTRTCSDNSNCSDIGYYCSDGKCQPAAVCETYCDEFMCCEYYNDPDDPTKCKQGTCYYKK